MSSRHRKTGERARQVERMKATREEEGRRDRETASRAPQQPTIIMVGASVYMYMRTK